MNRRRFLRSLLAFSGAAAVGAAGSAAAGTTGTTGRPGDYNLRDLVANERADGQPLRAGVLLPGGPASAGFLNGLRLALAMQGSAGVELLVEDTGANGVLAAGKARSLLAGGRAGLLTGLLGSTAEAHLVPMLEEHGVPLLSASLGEIFTRPADRHPLVLRHGLGLWQSQWSLGSWAAANLGESAIVLCGMAEVGYDFGDAFSRGFAAAGGSVLGPVVTDREGAHDFPAALAAAEGAEFIYANFSGPSLSSFRRAWLASGLGLPLVLGGFGGSRLVQHDVDWEGVVFAAPNLQGSEPVATAFTETYARRHGEETDPFALLGFETGLLLAALHLAPSPAAVHLTGPRGELRFEGDVTAPIPAKVVTIAGGSPATLGVMPGPRWSSAHFPAVRSGWGTPYLPI